jgi:hypothetical protein
MNTKVSLESNDNVIFDYESQLRFSLHPSITQIKTINFINIDGYEVLFSAIGSGYSGVMETNLNALLADSLTSFNRYSNFALLSSEYPLNVLFEEINKVHVVAGNGLLIAGEFRSYGGNFTNINNDTIYTTRFLQ